MNRKEFMAEVNDIHYKRVGALTSKGHDYATDDALSNFKRMSKLCEILNIDVRRSPADCAMFLKVLKLDRWCNLRASGKEPRNESVKDTVMDDHNYTDLAYGCDIDER